VPPKPTAVRNMSALDTSRVGAAWKRLSASDSSAP